MKITYIKIKKIWNQQKLVAVADVTIEDLIVIHDIRILSNKDNGLFMAMPSKKAPNGTFSDIVHPISASARNIFERLLFPATEKMLRENRQIIQYTLINQISGEIEEQNIEDFTVVDDDMRFVDESVKDEILSWLNL